MKHVNSTNQKMYKYTVYKYDTFGQVSNEQLELPVK
jgi:hypothetical protein